MCVLQKKVLDLTLIISKDQRNTLLKRHHKRTPIVGLALKTMTFVMITKVTMFIIETVTTLIIIETITTLVVTIQVFTT